MTITPEIIAAMREWVSDCTWADVESADDLTDAQIIRGVQAHYVGGVDAFIRDGNPDHTRTQP